MLGMLKLFVESDMGDLRELVKCIAAATRHAVDCKSYATRRLRRKGQFVLR